MSGENPPTPIPTSDGDGPPSPWTSRAMEQGESVGRRLLYSLRPGVSLLSGSVLILITLFLPIGYQSCGPETKGYELLQGKGDWPTFVGITLSDYFGPAFYGAALLLAAWTAVFTVMSLWKPAILGNRRVCRPLFIVAGSLSLFLIADVVAILPIGLDERGAYAGALILASCLAPGKFWPGRIFWKWIGLLIVPMLMLAGFTALKWIRGDAPAWFLLGIWAIYGLGPLALWWAQVSGRKDFGPRWNSIRHGLIAFYFPGVLGNLWFFFVAWREGIWGFVPCCLGIHLMALGYMRLAEEGGQAQAGPPAAGQ